MSREYPLPCDLVTYSMTPVKTSHSRNCCSRYLSNNLIFQIQNVNCTIKLTWYQVGASASTEREINLHSKPTAGHSFPSSILDTPLTFILVTAAESITDLITGRRKPSVSAGVTVITSPMWCACVTVCSGPLLSACVTVGSTPSFLTLECGVH